MNAMRSDAWQIEKNFAPSTLYDVAALRAAVIAQGYSVATANGIVGWLVGRVFANADATNGSLRTRYRKVLASLEHLPTSPETGPAVVAKVRKMSRPSIRKAA